MCPLIYLGDISVKELLTERPHALPTWCSCFHK